MEEVDGQDSDAHSLDNVSDDEELIDIRLQKLKEVEHNPNTTIFGENHNECDEHES